MMRGASAATVRVMTRPAASVRLPALLVALGLLSASPAPAQEAPPELTPFGAIRAADRNGFIPEWAGGLTQPVKGYAEGQRHPDPFFEDARWFTVGPLDLERYRVRLSVGLQELLKRHPSYEVPVYPTRRTAAAPQRIQDATVENAKSARLVENGLVVRDARVGIPFPQPKSGAEAMWNHLLRWRGGTVTVLDGVAQPDSFGNLALSRYRVDWFPAYSLAADAPAALLFKRTGIEPEEVAGGTLILQDALDPIRRPRAAWYRPPGETRVLRAPDFAYDTPDPATGGVRTADMLDMFSGMLDRFDFTLVGRRSMYAPYNAYRLEAGNLAPDDFLWAAHPNPSFLRYELHRLWVVDAKLKPGFRHPFPERTYYLDEDSWQIVMAEHFAPDGTLARYAEAHGLTYSQVPVFAPTMEITYDFPGNRYVVTGLDNAGGPPVFGKPMTAAAFAPESLRDGTRRR